MPLFCILTMAGPQPNPMHVGVCRLVLRMPENGSLKDKRQVMRSLMERVRNRFHVAVAEVDAQDRWDIGVLGVANVSNNRQHTEAALNQVVEFIQETRLDAELTEVDIQVVAY
ncbi:MAG: DUF503 domain-containing protein [Chloroflexota bacterium]